MLQDSTGQLSSLDSADCAAHYEKSCVDFAVEAKPAGAGRGKGLHAKTLFSRGDTLFSELPLASLQSADNKAVVAACAHCHRGVGSLTTNLRLIAGRCTRVDAFSSPELGNKIPQEEVVKGHFCDDVVLCQLGCGEVYCSSECCAEAFRRGHRLLCVGPLTVESALYKFKIAALETGSEEFFLGAQIVAQVICEAQQLAGDGNPVAATHVQQALQPIQVFEAPLPWWEVVAVPAEEQRDSKGFRALLCEQARQCWSLLLEGLEATHGIRQGTYGTSCAACCWKA
ncbi:hypothetical protein CYMTET_45685 [Cymbomonas tetramitiformis]|uniref:Uncharacterized protein n=1 Tax=Cymbomonas tetramitiformis TaxID=36881 RepID=A0AAE0EXU1_9CHLO|nr:hypothetical protein CYMTET_45685 [Cymbomonas tetramitiformis]